MKSTLVRWGALALMIGSLAGCGGGGGGGTTAPATGGGTAPGVTPPTGSAPVTVSNLTADQFAALEPKVVVGGVGISSAPQVSFSIADANNNPIIGFGAASGGNLTYLRFSIAKLVPGAAVPGTTTTTPSKWVNYIVVSSSGAAQRPNAERNGTLVDNGNGTYTYTFATDITRVKDQIAGMTFNGDTNPPTGENRKADLGDLTFDANLTHRLTIQLSGGGMENPVNAIYDFIPATGTKIASTETDPNKQRNVVSINNCNECHGKLALHGSARINTQYCVVCHTDQRRYGRANVTSTNFAFPALTETVSTDATTGFKRYSYSPQTYVGDGEAMGDFPRLIHKIHNGHDLIKQNYNFANVAFNLKQFSMLNEGQRMCAKCHKDSTDAKQTANWQTKPSRLACGACHDGINFDTGAGTTLDGLTTGHVGGVQPDTRCALCHDASNIPVYHRTENITTHNPTIDPALVTYTYEIKSAEVLANNDVKVVFQIKANGTPVTRLDVAGTTGGPGFLLAWTVAQDGIAAPIDFNNTTNAKGDATSISIARGSNNLLTNGNIAPGTGADAGYWVTTIPSARGFPVGARMRTVAIQSYYTQTSPASGRHAISVVKTVTGDTARRTVIDPAKCGNCHEWLELHGGSRVIGKDTQGLYVCAMCHVPAKATSGRGIADATVNTYAAAGSFSAGDLKTLQEWGLSTTFPVTVGSNWALGLPVITNNFKDMIHGIHKGRERVDPFRDARDRTPAAITLLDFRRLDFPGIIEKCETCHLAGTYNTVPTNALASTYESVNTAGNTTTALAKSALNQPNATDKVTSPFAAACVSCHDSTVVKSHMQISGGGQIMVERQAFVVGQEQCAFCHGPGKIVDVTVVHNR